MNEPPVTFSGSSGHGTHQTLDLVMKTYIRAT